MSPKKPNDGVRVEIKRGYERIFVAEKNFYKSNSMAVRSFREAIAGLDAPTPESVTFQIPTDELPY